MTEEEKKQAKEKAESLVDRYRRMFYGRLSIPAKKKAKICALIAVEEILKCNPHTNPFNTDSGSTYHYWTEVRRQIENI